MLLDLHLAIARIHLLHRRVAAAPRRGLALGDAGPIALAIALQLKGVFAPQGIALRHFVAQFGVLFIDRVDKQLVLPAQPVQAAQHGIVVGRKARQGIATPSIAIDKAGESRGRQARRKAHQRQAAQGLAPRRGQRGQRGLHIVGDGAIHIVEGVFPAVHRIIRDLGLVAVDPIQQQTGVGAAQGERQFEHRAIGTADFPLQQQRQLHLCRVHDAHDRDRAGRLEHRGQGHRQQQGLGFAYARKHRIVPGGPVQALIEYGNAQFQLHRRRRRGQQDLADRRDRPRRNRLRRRKTPASVEGRAGGQGQQRQRQDKRPGQLPG